MLTNITLNTTIENKEKNIQVLLLKTLKFIIGWSNLVKFLKAVFTIPYKNIPEAAVSYTRN